MVIEYIKILDDVIKIKTERVQAILSRTIYLQSSFPSPVKVQTDRCKYDNDNEKYAGKEGKYSQTLWNKITLS